MTSDLTLHFAGRPVHRITFDVTNAGLEALSANYQAEVFRTWHTTSQEQLQWGSLMLRFTDGAVVVAHGNHRGWGEVFAATSERARELHAEIIAKLAETKPAEKPFFYMLRYEGCEFYAERVENLPDDPGDEFLHLCYGPDVGTWLTQFHERTTSRAGGLTILDGPPGTGKTSLISTMMRRFEKSHAFYVLPTAQDRALSAPEFVPFWQAQNKRHPDRIKVIVIEDAERLLWPRRGDNRDAVSSVLNIADGLTGRMLRLHLLCSVNAQLRELDSAILRPWPVDEPAFPSASCRATPRSGLPSCVRWLSHRMAGKRNSPSPRS
ncbi:MAG: AAA family ATPase [Chthoniobacteraceae bacterium]